MVFDLDPLGIIHLEPNELNIFAAVVFASSPGVFRIVRGLTMDIKTRDYVAAAQTRGEGSAPESPDWGSMINQTRGFIRIVPTIVLPQTIALASLVLGLNLLADGLREESLRD